MKEEYEAGRTEEDGEEEEAAEAVGRRRVVVKGGCEEGMGNLERRWRGARWERARGSAEGR